MPVATAGAVPGAKANDYEQRRAEHTATHEPRKTAFRPWAAARGSPGKAGSFAMGQRASARTGRKLATRVHEVDAPIREVLVQRRLETHRIVAEEQRVHVELEGDKGITQLPH
jgi:hypothetical protein